MLAERPRETVVEVEEIEPSPGTPYVSAEARIPEINLRGLAVGSILGIFFAASSVYLALKVGITVSASIPIAVLSITLFRGLARAFRLRPATILENNIVQTTGSAGESVAAGVAFTLPALLLLGFGLELERVLLVALLGGLLGVLMMIPLRRGLIVNEDKKLTYPEGRAAADVLAAGEQGGTSARTVFQGFFIGLGYAACNLIFKIWSETASFAMEFWGRFRGGLLSFEVSPPMLGVGYIIGLRTAANMMAGGALAFLVLVPLAHLFGDALTVPLYPATKTIAQMTPLEIRSSYILYIGAGAVATGGLLALLRAIPTILSSFAGGLASLRAGQSGRRAETARTDRDLPVSVVLGGSLLLIVAIWLAPGLGINAATAALIVLCGFFFVTVSSRVTGELGSSSNPISGMTVACLLLTCGLFVLLGWTGSAFQVMALTSAAVLCVAISNGGTTSQDLKTGFLVGATPRHQQAAILVGVVTSALVIGATLLLLDRGNTTYVPVDIPGVRVAVPPDAGTENGPDGVGYRVVSLPEDHGTARRGRYLAAADGQLAFRIDPGVAGTFPFRFERVAAIAAARLPIPPSAPVELGLDRKPYRAVELDAAQGGLAAGRYLVRNDGQPVWAVRPAAKFDAPKSQLFALIIEGTLGGRLPWGLVLAGVFLALLIELLGVDALPFAVGLYLPISTSAAIFTGGLVRWLADRKTAKSAGSETGPGLLMASGLIAGGAIAGVLQAVLTFRGADDAFDLGASLGPLARNGSWWPMVPFLLLAAVLYRVAVKRAAGE
jgi:putative OPT family oligopeptide transporter